ncbi:hypothetical protein B0T22DRAFT_452367 [Podospora appendiculata]|uniref:Secreted protein n=1 Tax=Podospora appendiculata TaxID=314037 RepID=A0AAE1CH32_9PEZI|nr:hypothetical protein B0T22DRAFT_452367 [Podospora appendiculata]
MGAISRIAVLLAVVYPSLAVSDSPAAPKIASVAYSGNGCPRNIKQYGDFNDPTFKFTDFNLSYPGPTTQTLNCQVMIQTTGASPGWQVAVSDNWVRGHVYLEPGTALDFLTTVYFSQSASQTASVRGRINNRDGSSTLDQSVTLHNDLTSSRVWSPCTGSDGTTGILNVNFRGVLTGDGSSKAHFEASTENWDLDWRRC